LQLKLQKNKFNQMAKKKKEPLKTKVIDKADSVQYVKCEPRVNPYADKIVEKE